MIVGDHMKKRKRGGRDQKDWNLKILKYKIEGSIMWFETLGEEALGHAQPAYISITHKPTTSIRRYQKQSASFTEAYPGGIGI